LFRSHRRVGCSGDIQTVFVTGSSLETNELIPTFADFKILFYEDTEMMPQWGRQRVKRRIVRFIAQRE